MIHTILTWMESHVWICTFIIAGCAVLIMTAERKEENY